MPTTNQGINQRRYQMIPRTLIFLFDQQDRVLLLKGSAEKRLWAGLFNGIGGHIEAGEDILEAAYRELKEESGITDIELHFCGQIMIDVSGKTGVAIFIFRGVYEGSSFTDSPEGKLHWVMRHDIDNLPVVEDLPVLLPKISSFQRGDNPIVGKYIYGEDGQMRILFH